MSVISIRPSQERLRNLGEIRRPDRFPHFVSPQAHTADRSIVPRAMGDLARTIQQSGGQMLAAYINYRRSEDSILLARAGAEYQRRMRKEMLGADGSDGKPAAPGLMARKGDGIKGLGEEAQELEKRVFREVCDGNKLDGRRKELLRMHVNPVTQSWENHVANHVFRETERQKLASADVNSEESYETWQLSKFDTETAAKALSDFEYLRKQSGDTEEVAGYNVRKFAKGLVTDIIRDKESLCASEAAFDDHIAQLKDSQGRAGFVRMNAALYDELVDKPARKEAEALVMEGSLSRVDVADFLERRTGELEESVFSPKTVELLIDAAKQRKDRFVLEQTRAVNAEVDALVARGAMPEEKNVLKEMDDKIESLRYEAADLPKDSRVGSAKRQAAARLDKSADSLAERQMLSDCLDRLKNDPGYRIFNDGPVKDAGGRTLQGAGVADAYRGDPRKGRLAENVQRRIDRERMKRGRERAAANANEIAQAFHRLRLLKMNGDTTPSESATEQARIWSRFSECAAAGALPADFLKGFMSEFGRELDEQQAKAMRKLYAAFGYTGELDSRGGVPKSAQKGDTSDYRAPVPDGAKEGDRPKVDADELFWYGASVLRSLETADPKADREALVEREIGRCRTDWIKRRFFDTWRDSAARNARKAVRGIMDMQREIKASVEMGRPEGRSEEDDGRDGHGGSAR